MIEKAEGMGAYGIVGVRFQTSMIMQSTPGLLVYGTSVKLLNNSCQDHSDSQSNYGMGGKKFKNNSYEFQHQQNNSAGNKIYGSFFYNIFIK